MSDLPNDEGIDIQAVIDGILSELGARRRNRKPGDEPIWLAAIDIARQFEIRPRSSDDSRKKGVRNIIRLIREQRDDLISCLHGYALALDAADLAKYQDFRKRSGLAHLAEASKVARSTVADDTAGQMLLEGVK